MKRSDIATLLGFAAVFDGRIQVDEVKVEAWHLALASSMTYEFAKEAIAKHYAYEKDVVAPYHLNNALRTEKKSRTELDKSVSVRLMIEDANSHKASPEFVANIMNEIRTNLNKNRNNDNESN
jgi:hypothetical protein